MKKTPKILLITDSNFPYGGAPANFLRLFTKGVIENQHYIDVLIQKGRQFGNQRNQKKSGTINGLHFRHCCFANRPKNYFLKIIDDICGIIFPLFFIIKNRLTGKLSSVLMYNSNAFFSVLNIFLCKILGIPIFNFVVESYEKDSVVAKSPLRILAWYLFSFQFKIINRKYTGLIVLSTFLKSYYIKNGIKENKIHLQPNFIDFEIFENIYPIKNNSSIRIGYCGTPTRKDGIDDLLSAFSILQQNYPNTELLIIGDSTGLKSLISPLKERAKNLKIDQKTFFAGLVDFIEIPILLCSCDILVLARPDGIFAEAGFPTKLGEYMACKKPVVITKVGDIPLYLKDSVNAMLAEPDNPQSVADKIAFLIENPIKARLIGEEGYKWAKSILEYKAATKKVVDFIEKINN
jgi:glycosyltransferase involved in cell wall biosynthesis